MAEKPTSALLREIVEGLEGERVTLACVVEALGPRGFGLLNLLLTLPAVIPAPPGVGSIFGLPLMFFSVQMALGRHHPVLPRRLAGKTLSVADLRRVVAKAVPWLERLERFCRPGRLPALVHGRGPHRAVGGLILFLALLVALPGPFTNAPPGAVIALLCLSLIEEDGLLVVVGLVLSAVATVLALGGIAAFLAAVTIGLRHLLT